MGLVPKLSQRVGMLGKLNKYMSREQFRTTSDGIFTSCLLYCLPLFCNIWGLPTMDDSVRRFQTFTKEDCRKLQVLQNKVLKMKINNFEKNAQDQVFPARREGFITVNCDLTLSRSGFIYRAANLWNLLPRSLREEPKVEEIFKRSVKRWIKGNVPRKPH